MKGDRHEIDLGRIAAWDTGDDEGAPSKAQDSGPMTHLDDTPDDRWRDVLTWLFLPSLVGALSVWVLLHAWFNLSSGYGWAFMGIALVLYTLVGWRGRRLFLFVARSVRGKS